MILCAALAVMQVQVSRPRTVIISWDGAANWVVQRMLAERKLPNLQDMVSHGATANFMLPAFPSKTAVSHMSLFSGTTPDVNGVIGNSVPLLPKSEHTLLETRSGFSGLNHRTSPLWVVAAEQGIRVAALSAAGSFPPSADQDRLRASKTPLDRYVEFSGFEAAMAPEAIYTAPSGTIQIGEQQIHYEAQKSGTGKYEFVKLSGTDCDGKPFSVLAKDYPARTIGRVRDGWIGPFKCKTDKVGMAWFRLWSLDAETGKMSLYQRKVSGTQGTEDLVATAAYQDAYDGFHDDAATTYANGDFGKPLYSGGDGTAESRLLETFALDCEFMFRGFKYSLQNLNPGLIFHYSPIIDSLGHQLMGLLDKASPKYNARTADRLWPIYEQAYIILDRWLGEVRREAGNKTNYVLVSDHGMQGVGYEFNVNACLEAAGLLGMKDGKIDLSSTFVMAPPWADNMLVVNSRQWKGGVVEPAERSAILAKARAALLSVRSPEGHPVVKAIYNSGTAPRVSPGMADWTDLIIDLHTGYTTSSKAK